MNQLCKVCGEPAAGFHFGAFTCEGCKSFFGRTYNNIAAIAGCKNSGDCVINKKNRTACKACRLRKCLLVGMSKSGSRYGRRSNWFKIHCLLQEQQSQHQLPGGGGPDGAAGAHGGSGSSFEQLARLHQMQVRQTYQDKTNPCIKTAMASCSPTLGLPAFAQPPRRAQPCGATAAATTASAAAASAVPSQNDLLCAAKFLNGVVVASSGQHNAFDGGRAKSESRLSDTPSDSGASSAGEPTDECGAGSGGASAKAADHHERNCSSAHQPELANEDSDDRERRRQQFLEIFRSHSEPLRTPFMPFAAAVSSLPPSLLFPAPPPPPPPLHTSPAPSLKDDMRTLASVELQRLHHHHPTAPTACHAQEEPIDLSLKSRHRPSPTASPSPPATPSQAVADDIVNVMAKPAPLDLTLVRAPQTLTG